jgi:hypothetical protein
MLVKALALLGAMEVNEGPFGCFAGVTPARKALAKVVESVNAILKAGIDG